MSDQRIAASVDEQVAKALDLGKHLMDSLRKQNAEYAKRTGKPSKITEADYVDGENEIAAVALKYWGFGPIKAKRLIREYREAHSG